jgi:hypothetical protein
LSCYFHDDQIKERLRPQRSQRGCLGSRQ